MSDRRNGEQWTVNSEMKWIIFIALQWLLHFVVYSRCVLTSTATFDDEMHLLCYMQVLLWHYYDLKLYLIVSGACSYGIHLAKRCWWWWWDSSYLRSELTFQEILFFFLLLIWLFPYSVAYVECSNHNKPEKWNTKYHDGKWFNLIFHSKCTFGIRSCVVGR